MRRAIYQGRHALGFQNAFFYQVTDFVVEVMGRAYPNSKVQRGFIEKMVRLEEERFGATLTVGLSKLDGLFDINATGMPDIRLSPICMTLLGPERFDSSGPRRARFCSG